MTALSQLPLAALRQLTAQDSDDALVGQTARQPRTTLGRRSIAGRHRGRDANPAVDRGSDQRQSPRRHPDQPSWTVGGNSPPESDGQSAGRAAAAGASDHAKRRAQLARKPRAVRAFSGTAARSGGRPQSTAAPSADRRARSEFGQPGALAGTGHVAKQPAGPANPSEVPARGGAGTGRRALKQAATGVNPVSGQPTVGNSYDPSQPGPYGFNPSVMAGAIPTGNVDVAALTDKARTSDWNFRNPDFAARFNGGGPVVDDRGPLTRSLTDGTTIAFRATASNGPARRHRKNWPPCRPTSGVRFWRDARVLDDRANDEDAAAKEKRWHGDVSMSDQEWARLGRSAKRPKTG